MFQRDGVVGIGFEIARRSGPDGTWFGQPPAIDPLAGFFPLGFGHFDLNLQAVNFLKVIRDVCGALDETGVRYALIGGFAMALRGVQRSTVDLDFILMLEDLNKADAIFQGRGYARVFRSENVSHYQAGEPELGRIDILHAFRGPTLSMLDRAERIEVADSLSLPVVRIEDIIGLKVQAGVNDSRRRHRDWFDIREMLETCAEAGQSVDWEILEDYLDLFNLGSELPVMKGWYGAAD